MAISGSLNFITASELGSHIAKYSSAQQGRVFGIQNSSDSNWNTLTDFIPTDFIGLNTNIYEPITSSANTLGYPSIAMANEQGNSAGMNVNYINEDFCNVHLATPPTEDTANPGGPAGVLNSILLSRNGPYQHPSWKQYRGWQHPVARSMRLNNTMSIDLSQPKKSLTRVDKNWAHRERYLEKYLPNGVGYYHRNGGKKKAGRRRPKLRHFYEPPVSSKHHPFLYDISYSVDKHGLENATARQALTNEMMFFVDERVNAELKISSINPNTASATSYPKQTIYSNIHAATLLGADKFRYTETIFPRGVSTYRPFKLAKPNYEETFGIGDNGYDRTINRSFWRQVQGAGTYLATSSANSRFRSAPTQITRTETNIGALNSQEYVQDANIPGLGILSTTTPKSRKIFGGNQYPDADDPNPNLDSGLPGTGHWHRNVDFITNGIVANAVNTLTGGVDTYGNASSQPYGGFVQLESYQPYNISLLSMWPLDPRGDIYDRPRYLTSSIGGKGLQIGLTPHRASGSASTLAQVSNVITLASHAISDQVNITVPTAAGGNGQTYTIMFETVDATGAASASAYRLVVGESTGPSDGTVAETLVDMINGHTGTGNGTYGHNFAASGDVAGVGIVGVTATLHGTTGITLTADSAGSVGNSIAIVDVAGDMVAGGSTGHGFTTLMNGFWATDSIYQFTGSNMFSATEFLLTGSAGELVYSTKPTIFYYREKDAQFMSGTAGDKAEFYQGYLTPTASIQFLRHTYPYNTPFYATNKIVGRDPAHNSYAAFIGDDLRYISRDYSIVPEFRISQNYRFYENFISEYESKFGGGEKIFQRKLVHDVTRKQIVRALNVPIDHRLNFLLLDGASITASSDIVSPSDLSSKSNNRYRYNELSQSAILDGDFFNTARKDYGQREDAVNFYTKFSHTDLPSRNFSYLMHPHGAAFPSTIETIPFRIRFTCRAIKKLLPYSGFYPVARTAQIGTYLSSAFGPLLVNKGTTPPEHTAGTMGIQEAGNDPVPEAQAAATSTDEVRSTGRLQAFLEPFMAPGLFYNSIKSGIAVDYPIYMSPPRLYCPEQFFATSSASVTASAAASASFSHGGFHMMGSSRVFPAVLTSIPSYRLSFESLYDYGILQNFGLIEDSSVKGGNGFSYTSYLVPDFVDASKMPSTAKLGGYFAGPATSDSIFGANSDSIANAVYPYAPNAGLPAAQGHKFGDRSVSEYIKGINNYLAETMEFFLDDQKPAAKKAQLGIKFPVITSKEIDLVNIQTSGRRSYFCNLYLRMGRHQMMCEGPRRSGFGIDHAAEFQRSSSIRGYLYGSPIEIQPHGAGYDVSRAFSYGENPPSKQDSKPAGANEWDPAEGASSVIGQHLYKSYLAANLQDPAYQAYTPPYFYGASNLLLRYQVEKAGLEGLELGMAGSENVNLQQIFVKAKSHSQFQDLYDFTGSLCYTLPSTSSMSTGSMTRMKLNSSIDIFNIYKIESEKKADPSYIWYMVPKWVCPVLDFSASYSNFREAVYNNEVDEIQITDTLKQNIYHDETTGRSIWGGYGNDPYDDDIMKKVHKEMGINSKKHKNIHKGIYFGIEEAYTNAGEQFASFKSLDENLHPDGYFTEIDDGQTAHTSSMMVADKSSLGIFVPQEYQIGRMAKSKVITEAVVIIPYLDSKIIIGPKKVKLTTNPGAPSMSEDKGSLINFLEGEIYKTREIIPGKHFLPIHRRLFGNILSAILENTLLYAPSTPFHQKDHLFTNPNDFDVAIATDCGRMIQTLIGDGFKGGYQLPPEFDFIHNGAVDPFQMIILPFEHILEKHDLMNIYQNVMPDISTRAIRTVREVQISPGAEPPLSSTGGTSPIFSRASIPGGGTFNLSMFDTGMFLRPPPIGINEFTNIEAGGSTIDFYRNLKFMVFKIKQRGTRNYKKYRQREMQKVIQAIVGDGDEDTGQKNYDRELLLSPHADEVYGMNWPYDYFSLIEAIKLDVTFEVNK